MMVPLEAFTTWATRASPLKTFPRHDRCGVPGRFTEAVSFACGTMKAIIYENLRFGSHRVRGIRGQQS